ncbi:hypothetical protein O983_27815 [Mycobacterium avium 09-5983]|nr:hypothetical protein O983_27815 [Mycobacterium avium 09-5983]
MRIIVTVSDVDSTSMTSSSDSASPVNLECRKSACVRSSKFSHTNS